MIPNPLTVRIGCRVAYQTLAPTPALLVVRPRLRPEDQRLLEESFAIAPEIPYEEFEDGEGNITCRLVFPPGKTTVRHDALIELPSHPDNIGVGVNAVPIDKIPPPVLRYALPSRYCDSDKLLDFAWNHFGPVPNGVERVRSICDWVHRNIEYRFGSGRPDLAASEVIARRYGVCRDFAHVAIALCRAFNIPARYVSGHLPDIGFQNPGTAMDFHAYFEAFLDGKWSPFDARFNVPRIGRIKVAHGLDAVDGAFTTIFGQAELTWFEVWAYQVPPGKVKLGDPIDLSRRLDGTPEVKFS